MVNLMPKCVYCNNQFPAERKELGLDYCLNDSCYKKGIHGERLKFREEFVPALLHKCNYFWVKRTDLKQLNTRGDLPNQ